MWQTNPGAGPWSGWNSRGGNILGGPTVGGDGRGRLRVFARGDSWSDWASLGGQIVGAPAVCSGHEGREDDRLYTQWQKIVNGDWSGWNPAPWKTSTTASASRPTPTAGSRSSP